MFLPVPRMLIDTSPLLKHTTFTQPLHDCIVPLHYCIAPSDPRIHRVWTRPVDVVICSEVLYYTEHETMVSLVTLYHPSSYSPSLPVLCTPSNTQQHSHLSPLPPPFHSPLCTHTDRSVSADAASSGGADHLPASAQRKKQGTHPLIVYVRQYRS